MKKYLPNLVALTLLFGCANTDYIDDDGGPSNDVRADADTFVEEDTSMPDLPPLPDGFDLHEPVVFAHDATALYKVEPETLRVSKIADFIWPADPDKMTDLAVDKKGKMVGISRTAVYSVDAKTGQCEYLAPLTRHFVGLSFVPDEAIDTDDILVGIDKEGGQVDTIDPETGTTSIIGTFGDGLLASGDIVSVKGFGTVATVIEDPQAETDLLARIDVKTGKATPIGDTGFSKIWGLGFWKDKLYGFTSSGEFILIDVTTGAGTLVQTDEISWWGAGVTTKAPVIN